jgi:CRP-like cAMP-binding protein
MQSAFEALVAFPAPQWEEVKRRARLVSVPKGEILVRPGEAVDWLGFLEHGLVRNFQLVGTREVNLGFDAEGGYVGDYEAYMRQQPATLTIEALEPSELVRFERAQTEVLMGQHPCWRELLGRISEVELLRRIEVERDARTLTPEQRYAALERADSLLLRRVPLYHLASYLGVAPETLSRIRARLGNPRGS